MKRTMRKSALAVIAIAVLLSFGFGLGAAAATYNVPGMGATTYPTITAALAAASSDDIISVAAAYDSATAGENFPITVTKNNISIIGASGAVLRVPASHAGVVFKGVTGGKLEGFVITSLEGADPTIPTIGDIGVVVKESNNVTVKSNTIYNLLEGIRLYSASNTTLSGNRIYDIGEIKDGNRTGIGIFLEESGTSASDGNFLTSNTVHNAGVGVFYYRSHYNSDAYGNYYGNTSHGVDLNDSNYNKLTNLTVGGPRPVTGAATDHDGNGSWGIFLSISDHNTIKSCDVQGNKVGGIELSGSQHNDIDGNYVRDNGLFLLDGTIGAGETIQIMVGPGQKAEFFSDVLEPGAAGKPDDPFDKAPNDVRTEIRALKGALTHLQAKIADLDVEMAGVVSKLEAAIGIVYQLKLNPQTSSVTFLDDVRRLNEKLGAIEDEKDKIFCKIGPLDIDTMDPTLRTLIDLQMAKCSSIILPNPPFDKNITAEKQDMIDEIQALKVKIRNLRTAEVIDSDQLEDELLQKLDTMTGILFNVDAKLLDIVWKLFVANVFTPTPAEKDAIINNPGDCDGDGDVDGDDIACRLDEWLTKRNPPGGIDFPTMPPIPNPQQIEINVCEAIDTSGSINDAELDLQIDGFLNVLDTIYLPLADAGATIRMAIVGYSTNVTTFLSLTVVKRTNEATIKAAFESVRNTTDRNMTNIGGAINTCATLLAGGSGRDIIDISTDGCATEPTPDPVKYAKDAADAAKAAGIEIWAIGVGDGIYPDLLEYITGPTPPAQWFYAANFQEFGDAIFTKVVRTLVPASLIDAKLWVEEAIKEAGEIPGLLCNDTTPPIDSFCEWIAEFNRELPPPPFEVNGSGLIGKKEKPDALGDEVDGVKTTLATRLSNYTENGVNLVLKRAQDLGKIAVTDTTIPSSLIDATVSALRPSSFNIIESNTITMAIRNPNSMEITGPGGPFTHKANVGLKLRSSDNVVVNNLIANDVGNIYDQIGKLDVAIILQSDDNMLAYNTIEWVNTGIIRGGGNTRNDIQHEYLFKKLATTVCSPLDDPPAEPCLRPLEKMIVLEVDDTPITVTHASVRVTGNRLSLNFFDHVGIGIEIVDAESNQIDENLFLENTTGGVVFLAGSNPIHIVVEHNDHVRGLSYVNFSAQAVDASENYALNSPVVGNVNPPAATSRFCEANFEINNQKFVTLGTLIQTKLGMSPTVITKFYNSSSPTLPPNMGFIYSGVTLPEDKPRTCDDIFGEGPGPQPGSSCCDLEAGWNFISLPVDPDNADPTVVFLDDPLYLCTYNTATSNFEWVDKPASATAGTAGLLTTVSALGGYWLASQTGGQFCVTGTALTGNQVVDLATLGWHMIGVPYDTAWGNATGAAVKFTRNGVDKWLTDAVAANWIYGTVIGWDTTADEFIRTTVETGTTLVPCDGYWIRTRVSGLTMTFTDAPWDPGNPPTFGTQSLKSEDPGNPPMPVHVTPLTFDPSKLEFGNYPNPVTDVHTTRFAVMGAMAAFVDAIKVQIFDLSGQKVYEEEMTGTSIDWHTDNDYGEYLANGVYLYKMYAKVQGQWVVSEVKKLAILR